MSEQLEAIINTLELHGWIRYLDSYHEWKFGETGRYVTIDGAYIDFFVYNGDDDKYASYLTIEEFEMFHQLINCLIDENKLLRDDEVDDFDFDELGKDIV